MTRATIIDVRADLGFVPAKRKRVVSRPPWLPLDIYRPWEEEMLYAIVDACDLPPLERERFWAELHGNAFMKEMLEEYLRLRTEALLHGNAFVRHYSQTKEKSRRRLII